MNPKVLLFAVLAALSVFLVPSSMLAAPPQAPPAAIVVPDDLAHPMIEGVKMDVVPVDVAAFEMAQTPNITPVMIITQAQSDQLVFDTFTLAASVFGAMLSIIAMGAGIGLGFRIAREVRGFLSGG